MLSKREYKYFLKGCFLTTKNYTFSFDWNPVSQNLISTKSKFKRLFAEWIFPLLHILNAIYFFYLISEYKTLDKMASFGFTVNAYICLVEGFFCMSLLGSKEHRLGTFMDLYNQVNIQMRKRNLTFIVQTS